MNADEERIDAVEQIRQIRRDIERAEGEQDSELLGEHFDEGVTMSPTNGPHISGARSVVEYHRDLFKDWGEMNVEFTIEEISICGGLAVERGTYEFQMTPPGEDEVQEGGGDYLYTYERDQDGTWKIIRMSWGTVNRFTE